MLSGELAPRQEGCFLGCAVSLLPGPLLRLRGELAPRPRSWSYDHFVLCFDRVVVVAGNNYTDGGGCRKQLYRLCEVAGLVVPYPCDPQTP